MIEKEEMQKLDELVKAYALNKSEVDDLKKVCDKQNAEIKKLMSSNELPKWEVGDYTATYTVRASRTTDEDKMLEILKADWIKQNGSMECPYIKTKEYLDTDALEDAIFRGELSKELLADLNSCSTIKSVPTLTVKKKEN